MGCNLYVRWQRRRIKTKPDRVRLFVISVYFLFFNSLTTYRLWKVVLRQKRFILLKSSSGDFDENFCGRDVFEDEKTVFITRNNREKSFNGSRNSIEHEYRFPVTWVFLTGPIFSNGYFGIIVKISARTFPRVRKTVLSRFSDYTYP